MTEDYKCNEHKIIIVFTDNLDDDETSELTKGVSGIKFYNVRDNHEIFDDTILLRVSEELQVSEDNITTIFSADVIGCAPELNLNTIERHPDFYRIYQYKSDDECKIYDLLR